MRPRKIYPGLAALALAALLLQYAPATNAQRRRPPAPAPPRAGEPARRTETQTPPPRTQAPTPRRQEADSPLEELLAADSYGVYAEVRKVGHLVQSGEVKAALGALSLFGQEAKEIVELVRFVEEHEEVLGDARVVVAFLPARAELPQGLLALQLPSVESAVSFEPKYRAFLSGQAEALAGVTGQQAAPTPARGSRRAARGRKPAGPSFVLRRAGSWLLAADSPFTLKRLRGDGTNLLADSPRFQSARGRFASESLFVYVDTSLAQQGFVMQMQKAHEAQAAAASQGGGQVVLGDPSLTEDVTLVAPPAPVRAPETAATETTSAQGPAAINPPEVASTDVETDEQFATVPDDVAVRVEGDAAATPDAASVPATAEQLAVAQLSSGVLRHLWGGIPRIPGAFAVAANLEGDTLALRVAVENTPDGVVSIIPFLPNVVSGPPVTAESAQVAPADADIFFSASLDWRQIFNSVLGTAELSPVLGGAVWGADDGPAGRPETERPPPAGELIAAVEKLFGFKFKEDLLPALGNEVAVSMPLDFLRGVGKITPAAEKEEKEAEVGFVVMVALNNPDKVRSILPRALAALGFVPPGAAFRAEKRQGFEIRSAGSLSYAIINNVLVVGDELKSVRHVIDANASNRTLAASNSYRDTTEWQARQRLAHAFVAESLMKKVIGDIKGQAGGSADSLVQALLAQLDLPPVAASYSATGEGDALVHEARLPLPLVKAYSMAAMIGVREAPVVSNEALAVYALSRIHGAEESFKGSKGRQHYGTLEELLSEGLLEKSFMERLEYKIELRVAGDKFEATATPRNYGKTGRRSFFVDEKGIVRGADHNGEPATAEDPPVD